MAKKVNLPTVEEKNFIISDEDKDQILSIEEKQYQSRSLRFFWERKDSQKR